ncbi:MAG: hypothetical protein PUE71_00190 [Clostridia bacterium]|nr:hypothetical protein [Clostridia bacterium]
MKSVAGKKEHLKTKSTGVKVHVISGKSEKKIKVARKNAATKTLESQGIITVSEAEMDARAQEAIKIAVKRAKICNKPVAVYDKSTKKTYLEYADGERKYVE